MKQKYRILPVLLLWAGLTVCAWLLPAKAASDAERRPLAQAPELTAENLQNGSFMTKFEDYCLDQFPMRDNFRTLKSLFHYFALGQRDNNGIYLSNGAAVKQEYPLDEKSVSHALNRFGRVYEKYLQDSGGKILMAVVPDKGYYLAEKSGQLAMDYDALFEAVRQGMPWAEQVALTDCLGAEDYYRTDTHWRQERLLPAAEKIAQALGVTAPKAADFTEETLPRPFYGVYYGQAALPMAADSLTYLDSPILRDCTVFDYETGKIGGIYDKTKENGKDLYELFLSGAKSLLTVENPHAGTERELVIFRDSFGSSLAPLLMQDYARVTLVDIRYLQTDALGQFLDFHGQDVLFLYSTLVLNNSGTMK